MTLIGNLQEFIGAWKSLVVNADVVILYCGHIGFKLLRGPMYLHLVIRQIFI